MPSWYEEPDGRGHYDPQPYDEPLLASWEELRDQTYQVPEKPESVRRMPVSYWYSLKPYVCPGCGYEGTDISCQMCGKTCVRRVA